MHTMLFFRVCSYASTPQIRHIVCTHANSMLPATHGDFLLQARRRFWKRKCRHVPADERHPDQRPAAKRQCFISSASSSASATNLSPPETLRRSLDMVALRQSSRALDISLHVRVAACTCTLPACSSS